MRSKKLIVSAFTRKIGATSSALPPTAVILWIVACTWLNILGWGLSLGKILNSTGYIIGLIPLIAFASWLLFKRPPAWRKVGARLHWRTRHFFPLSFMVIAAVAILGGAVHAPNNYDGLSYRVPRVLNWLSEGHWFWIDTVFQRLNTRAAGFEWVSAPLLLFTRSDRLLFLPNAISFLLMPGLIYSLFCRLRVSRRVAWQWMWLLPTGYCYVLQAGSIGNDLFGAVLALAAVDLALRSWKNPTPTVVWLSMAAAAVLTAVKTNNMTLGLCWLAPMLIPLWRTLVARPLMTVIVGLGCSVASFLPTAALNQYYCGDWSGAKAERLTVFMDGIPLVRVANSIILVVINNAEPPIFPMAAKWNALAPHLIPSWLNSRMEGHFELGGAHWQVEELQVEESASLGLGLMVLLFAGGMNFFGRSIVPPKASPEAVSKKMAWSVIALAVVGMLVFFSKNGLTTTGRLSASYYPLVLPILLLLPGFRALIRNRGWRLLCAGVMGMALLLVIISPARPLWPEKAVLTYIQMIPSLKEFTGWKRAETVYDTYRDRNAAFNPLLPLLPNQGTIGLVTFDNPETSLWKPFGTRTIKQVGPKDTRETLLGRGIQIIAVGDDAMRNFFPLPVDKWAEKIGANKTGEIDLKLRANDAPQKWTVWSLE